MVGTASGIREFRVRYTGDYLDAEGCLALPDIALDLYASHPAIRQDYLTRQSPPKGDNSYWDRLYDLEITADDIGEADAIVIFRPWVRASAFRNGAARLLAFGRAGAGVDKIDLAACTANDVAVFNAPDGLTHSTASSAFLLLLACAKRLREQEAIAREGRWDLQARTVGVDLPGKVLGIVGLGASGRELARLVRPWNMEVIAFSPRADPQRAAELGVTLVSSLAEIFSRSDFVSLHNKLDASTRGLIGLPEFRLMKPGACFVNVARGEIVRETELVEALEAKLIGSAGLDVFEHEPIRPDHPLTRFPNVVLTPHWLPSTRDAARLTMTRMANGVIRLAQGLVPDSVVNPEVLGRPGFQAKLERFASNRQPA